MMNRIICRRRFLTSSVGAAVTAPFLTFRRAIAQETTTKTRSMAEFGEPLYKDGIENWPYCNPKAPKGGTIVLADFGSFDSLNPIIQQGDWPSSIGLISDGLTTGSDDELSTAYPLIAETFEYPADKSWIV